MGPPTIRLAAPGCADSRALNWRATTWTAQRQFGGSLLGEHLGQLLAIGWSLTLSVLMLRSRILPRWLGAAGLVVSATYVTNQGDILATALPGFRVWDLGGLLGSVWTVTVGGRDAPAATS